MNFLERRSVKRIQDELTNFLSPGEVVVDFDLSDFMVIDRTGSNDLGGMKTRAGKIRIAITNLAAWIAVPPSVTEESFLLQLPWDEVLEFKYNREGRNYLLYLIDGRTYYFDNRMSRRLDEYATERIREVEATMSAEQIEARRNFLSEAKRGRADQGD